MRKKQKHTPPPVEQLLFEYHRDSFGLAVVSGNTWATLTVESRNIWRDLATLVSMDLVKKLAAFEDTMNRRKTEDLRQQRIKK